jgi:hypothetical protein
MAWKSASLANKIRFKRVALSVKSLVVVVEFAAAIKLGGEDIEPTQAQSSGDGAVHVHIHVVTDCHQNRPLVLNRLLRYSPGPMP